MNFSNACCSFHGQSTIFLYLISPKSDVNKLLKEFVYEVLVRYPFLFLM